jgi:two-component system response regulator
MDEPTGRWMLVVEDNPDDERLATRTFKQSGRNEDWRVARDGEEALEMLKWPVPPLLVLLDLKLPRLSGVDVLTAIRDDPRLGKTPVVVLTSSDERTDLAACYALGCNAFVRKPVEFTEYTRDLKTTLDFWLNVNRTPPMD